MHRKGSAEGSLCFHTSIQSTIHIPHTGVPNLQEVGIHCKLEFFGHRILTYEFSRECVRAEVTVSDSGESHQAPPEAVEERPGTLGVVLLSEVNQAGNISKLYYSGSIFL